MIGVDPSQTMLDYARRQPGAESVRWIHGDASRIPPTGTADLAICTGNAIQHLDAGQLQDGLTSLAAALRPGGMLSFDSRNPAYREWERWTPVATYRERVTPVGQLREWLEVTEVDGGRVAFDAHNVFPDGTDRVYRNTLHFRTAGEFRRGLAQAGFTSIKASGDWRGAPVSDESPILVFLAT